MRAYDFYWCPPLIVSHPPPSGTKVHRVICRAYRKKATSEEVVRKLRTLAKNKDGTVDGNKLRLFFTVEQIVAHEEKARDDEIRASSSSGACTLL